MLEKRCIAYLTDKNNGEKIQIHSIKATVKRELA